MNNEPVAWMIEKNGKQFFTEQSLINGFHGYDKIIPLYTHPVKELTDEEIVSLYKETEADNGGIREFARAILRKAQE